MKKSKWINYLIISAFLFCCAIGAGYYQNYTAVSKAATADKGNLNEKNKDGPKAVDGPITQKEIFLTIDDGPSSNTTKIINILNENGIKATFFVVGKTAEKFPDMIKKLDENGMCVVSHTYTHDYKIYNSIATYMADLNQCNQVLKNLLGKEPVHFIRFPGGSDNRVSNLQTMKNIRQAVKDQGIYYVDWNVSSSDAAPGHVTAEQIENNMISQSRTRKFVVSLMHDAPGKDTTIEALPMVIKSLKEQGFVFRTFQDITPTEIKELEKLKVIYR